jgi:hypothetical protein
MERLQIHRWSKGAGLGVGPEYSGSPLQKLRLPLRDLVDVNVELPRQIGQRLLVLQRSQCHICLECWTVIPAHSFRHRLLIRSHPGRCQAETPLRVLLILVESLGIPESAVI